MRRAERGVASRVSYDPGPGELSSLPPPTSVGECHGKPIRGLADAKTELGLARCTLERACSS
eukprot:scaffold85360_cov23-Tisochrysis_lutea.AAC.1